MNNYLQSTNSEPDLRLPTFVDWLRETVDPADHHIALIDRVENSLRADCSSDAEAQSLIEKLERWRSQHVQQREMHLSPRDEAFVAALNVATNHIAGRTDLPPRRTYQAIHHPGNEEDLLSEAAATLDPRYPLERLIDCAAQLTTEHFNTIDSEHYGNATRRMMLLYAPLYVSSHCVNHCTYCGFRYPLDIERRHLSLDEVEQQIALLQRSGFGHLLIVGGDFPHLTTTDYYCDVARLIVQHGIQPAVEIASQSTSSYKQLAAAGICGVTLYQETYDERLYAEYHTRGPKANYHWRLESHDRAAEAGISRLGLGVLLGLADPHQDTLCLMRHGAYLRDRFPDCRLAFSLPRIHEGPDGFKVKHPVSDEQLVRSYCALRVAFPKAHLVLSTRESVSLRNQLASICITQMSAGSSTTPGGYGADHATSGEQFAITDQRSAGEVAQWLEQAGLGVAWSIEHS